MIEQIQELTNRFPDNLEMIVENSLYLQSENYRDNVKEKVFFNFSNEIPNSDDDNEVNNYLESFQEEFIAPRYYQDRGSVQWNYYTVFVIDGEYDEKIVSKIEKNKDYTRKIVLQKEKFNDFLDKETFIQEFYSTETNLAPNLINQWDVEISANNLNFICDGTYKKDWIEKLLDKPVETTEIEELVPLTNNELETRFPENSFINRLELGGYRPYPNQRDFNFSKVNLIHGVNGSGKTSLLESIEALTCGKIQRDTSESDFTDLVLHFNDSELRWFNTPMIYKNRDKEWYSSTNEGQNKLYENFNRFNFYHADAANEISNDGNIDKIVKDIVLGKDVAKYEKNISDAIYEFEKEERKISNKYIPSLKKDIDSINQQIETIEDNKTLLNETEIKFKNNIESINWKKQISDYEKIQDIFFEINELKNITNELYTLSNEIELNDLSIVDEKIFLLNKDHKTLEDNIKNISEVNRKKDEFIKKVNTLSSRIANLDKLSEWIQIERVSEIIGLDDSISEKQKNLSFFENIFRNEELNKDFERYKEKNSDLFNYASSLNLELEKQKNDLNDLIEELDIKEKEIGTISSNKTNLQEYVLKTMSSTKDKETCPVCKTTFTEENLSSLIKNITENIEGLEYVNKLKSDINLLEKEIKNNLDELEVISKVIYFIERLSPNLISSTITIKDAIKLIYSSYEKMRVLKVETKELVELKNFFVSKGITEYEYEKLIKAYNDKYTAEYGEISIKGLFEIKSKYIDEITNQKDTINSFEEQIKDYSKVIDVVKKNNEIFNDNNQEVLAYLSSLLQKLHLIKKYKEKISLYITVENFSMESIKKQIDNLSTVSSQYKETLLQTNKTSTLEIQLKQENDLKTEEYSKNIANKEKISRAIETLQSLVSSENILEDFFIRNTSAILDVFMTIHAPKEFNGLRFQNDSIELKRSINDEWVGVNKISTGQKSALALAVFLVMNRNAGKAPKYILFDDPVSNTDDINILAFFDFLRDISLSGQRQVFFVTANSKVANLFKKKFDFLGDDFKYYHLER